MVGGCSKNSRIHFLLQVHLLVLLFAFPLQAQIYLSGPLSGTLIDTTYIVKDTFSVSSPGSHVIEASERFEYLTYEKSKNSSIQGGAISEYCVIGSDHAHSIAKESHQIIKKWPIMDNS